ncbi:MAG: enoyl-CoA hydratase-related protein [Candidatus Nanopelagicales bacterium]
MKVITERRDHVFLIGVNRPEKRNAFDLEVIDEFSRAYEELGTDPELRVGVVHAIGDHFSAGLDLAEVGPQVAQVGPGALAGTYRYDPWGMWAPPVPKPVVLAVQGISYTLTIELALASDVVVAASDVRFRQLEIGRGILPFGGATLRATAQLGWGNAMRFLLTADEFGADEAYRIGLVQEVVEPGPATRSGGGDRADNRRAGAARCAGDPGQRPDRPRPRRGRRPRAPEGGPGADSGLRGRRRGRAQLRRAAAGPVHGEVMSGSATRSVSKVHFPPLLTVFASNVLRIRTLISADDAGPTGQRHS